MEFEFFVAGFFLNSLLQGFLTSPDDLTRPPAYSEVAKPSEPAERNQDLPPSYTASVQISTVQPQETLPVEPSRAQQSISNPASNIQLNLSLSFIDDRDVVNSRPVAGYGDLGIPLRNMNSESVYRMPDHRPARVTASANLAISGMGDCYGASSYLQGHNQRRWVNGENKDVRESSI